MNNSNSPMLRRDFLRLAVIAALPGIFGCSKMTTAGNTSISSEDVDPPSYTPPPPSTPPPPTGFEPPTRVRGSTVINVLDYGAVGNGSKNDTKAIQKAIDALPSNGGTVYIPAGTYMIGGIIDGEMDSIKLRSNMHLKLHSDAKLKAIPNNLIKYNIVLADVIKEVEISGGEILGERDDHQGTEGEGGHCIRIRGSQNVTIRDIRLADGWGDGLCVGPKPVWKKNYIYSKDVVANNVICDNNRRNGLSIGNVIGMKVYNSQFINTNGTKPQCGIDVEPDKDIDGNGYCDQVRIENCLMAGNARYGINVWYRSRNLTITKSTIEKNQTCGLVTEGLTGGTFTDNIVRDNMSTGIFIQKVTADVKLSGNTFYRNYLKQPVTVREPFCKNGIVKGNGTQKDLIVNSETSNIQVGSNCYE